MAFTKSENFNAEGNLSSSVIPGIYLVELVNVDKGSKTWQDVTTETLDFSFKILSVINAPLEEDYTKYIGKLHVDSNKKPQADKEQAMYERILHIAYALLNKEDYIKFSNAPIDNFTDLINLSKKLIGKSNKVELKIVGSQYNGSPVIKVPYFGGNYTTPFIKKEGGEMSLKFTSSEVKQLAEYVQAIKGKSEKPTKSNELFSSSNKDVAEASKDSEKELPF